MTFNLTLPRERQPPAAGFTPANHPLRGIPVDPPIALRGIAAALARMTAQLDLTVRKDASK